MVFVIDEGSVFEAPLEKIWRLNISPIEHLHQSMKNLKIEPTADPLAFLASWDSEWRGSTSNMKAKFTFFPPLGFTADFVEGPFAGSKEFEYYIPMGDKTGITCVGEFIATGFSDDELKAAVSDFEAKAFEEDQENLARMK